MKKIFLILLFLCSIVYGQSGRILDVNDDPYYIESPYDGNDLREIQYAQLHDIMYLAHPDYTPQKLTRSDHDDWEMEDVEFEGGPFLDENTTSSSTIETDGTTGDVNMVATGGIFDDDHVGSIWQVGHVVEANTVKGTFVLNWASNNPSDSLFIAEGREYDFMTAGTWNGTVRLQRSYDEESTWEDVYAYSARNNGNVQYSGREENEDAYYRVSLDDDYTQTDRSYLNYTLTARSYIKYGIIEITAVTDANNAEGTVDSDYPLDVNDATWRWSEGSWSDYRGFPRAVCFYQNRLCFAGTAYQPNVLWCSQSADYENFDLGEGLDNEAIAREIGSAGANPIMWIKDKDGIIAGTTGAIIKIMTPSSKYVFTPTTITSERAVETGACSIQPGLTNSSIIYVDRNRKKVRDLGYDVTSDDMSSPDLTLFSDDITDPNIQEMSWQKRPDELGWFVKADGNMVSLTYNPMEGVAAWTEQATDGNFVSVCCIPGEDEDEVWVAVERDSNDLILIEKFHNQNWIDDIWFVDSGLEYDDTATTTITGLGHLEGEEVQVYSDANGFLGDFTVSSGEITLDSNETQCIAGLGYTATIQTFPIEVSTELGPSVGSIKNMRQITLCLYESEGGRYGYDTMYDILYPDYDTDFFSGLAKLDLDTGFQQEVYLIVDQNEPLPLGITGVSINKYELSTDN